MTEGRVREVPSSSENEKAYIWKFPNPNINLKLCQGNPFFFGFIYHAIYEGIQELGIPIQLTEGECDLEDENSIQISTVIHEIRETPKRYIAYNWEQLTTEIHRDEAFYERFRKAVEVWDYSPENIKEFEKRGIKARWVLPGYHISMSSGLVTAPDVPKFQEKTVLLQPFFAINDRRRRLLDLIEKKCKRVIF